MRSGGHRLEYCCLGISPCRGPGHALLLRCALIAVSCHRPAWGRREDGRRFETHSSDVVAPHPTRADALKIKDGNFWHRSTMRLAAGPGLVANTSATKATAVAERAASMEVAASTLATQYGPEVAAVAMGARLAAGLEVADSTLQLLPAGASAETQTFICSDQGGRGCRWPGCSCSWWQQCYTKRASAKGTSKSGTEQGYRDIGVCGSSILVLVIISAFSFVVLLLLVISVRVGLEFEDWAAREDDAFRCKVTSSSADRSQAVK